MTVRPFVYLASQSPRRAQLLDQLGVRHALLLAEGDEDVEALEAEHLRRVLGFSRNLDEAATTLGIDPATLYRKRQKLGLL